MATARKATTRRRNVAMGMTIGSGPGRVFHPFRSSSDYDPYLAGEKKKRKPAAKKKAVAKKRAAPRKKITVKKAAPKRKVATKRVAIKKRAVVRKRAVAKKTVRRNPVGGPMSMFGGVKGPTLAQARLAGSKYGSPSSEFYGSPILAWNSYKRIISTYYMSPEKLASVKTAFLAGFESARVSPGARNPKRKLAKRGTPARKPTVRKLVRVPGSESLVAKSEYLASIKKVRNMLPVNSRVAVVGVAPGAKKTYLLIVGKKDAAVARAIAQSAAKTMTKKAK